MTYDHNISNIPLIYHPTSVTFVDDEKNFLLGLELDLNVCSGELNHYFSDPEEGLCFINNAIATTEYFIKKTNNIENESQSLIKNLHHVIYNKNRFNILSTVVVDYRMSKLDGLSLCKNINSNIVQKILLTAEDDTQLAINSLNNGTIDQFISKKPLELTEELNVGIQKAKTRYFRQISFQLMFGVSSELEKLLLVPEFQRIFYQTKKDSKAVEFYLIDNSGTFLFLDKDANPTWLIIRNNRDFLYQMEILSGLSDDNILRDALSSRKKVLFLSTDEDYKKEIKFWYEYLFDAVNLDSEYFYAVCHTKFNQIKWADICPFSTT